MGYWYIWYEIYEDGKRILNSKGRYYRAYKYKSSAERRAKQMWGKDLENPMTGAVISRRWIISQTCPWEDVYIFKTKAEAEQLLAGVKLMAQRYGLVTRGDVRDLIDKKSNYLDLKYGWIEDEIKKVRIAPMKTGYFVEFPRAVPID